VRITRLHLRAYGHFTDHSFDFGPEPRLHLVYGDNEAGKSTALRALSSVLFGYPHEVVDGFKHDAKDITIGAELIANDSSRLSFVRRRRGKNALVNADGTALDESTVAAFLSGASQEMFEKVFALDHHRLHEHARALLAEGGSLGFSLAEAGSGVVGLRSVLDGLRDERSVLFLAGGSKPKLNQLISKLADLNKEGRRRTVSPNEYKKRQNQIKEVEAALQEARDQKKVTQAKIGRLERIAKNLPLRAEHQALSRKIEELYSVPLLPPELTQPRIKAQTDRDTAEKDLNAANTAIEVLDGQIAAIVLDERTLERRQDIERLAEQRAVIENTEKDLPKREAERDQHYSTAHDLLTKAELVGDPEDLSGILPSVLKRKAISTLVDSGTKLIAQRATAAENVEKAADDLKKAEQQTAQAPKPLDAGDLSATLTAADRLGDISADISKRTRALERKSQALTETITGLGIRNGAASPLRELVVPPEKTVSRYKELFSAVDKEIGAVDGEIERLENETGELEANIATLKRPGDVATENDLQAARRTRDEGWALVRGVYIDQQSGLDDRAKVFAPDGRIADVYEEHVGVADHIADVIRTHVEEATELSLLERRKAEIEIKTVDAVKKAKSLGSQRNALLSEWRNLWPAGIATLQLPDEMVEWLKRREVALVEATELEEEHDEIAELVKSERDTIGVLGVALKGFAPAMPNEGLDQLRDRARRILEDIAKANTQHAKANEAVRAQIERKTQAEQSVLKLEAQIGEWTQKWSAALAQAGLNPKLSIESVSVILDVMNNLDGLKIQIDSLSHRIKTMEQDLEGFQEAVSTLAYLVPSASKTSAIQTCRQLEANLEAAKTADTELKGLQAQLKIRSMARDQAQENLRQNKAALETLCAQAGCIDPKDLAEIERKSAEKQQALRDRDKLETRIREDGAGLDLEALFAECDDVVGDQIFGEISVLRNNADETETQIEKLLSNRATLTLEFDRLVAQNQAADSMQEAAIVEAEISEMVEAYVSLTVQETLLRQAIDLYRDRNQGPILKRAKDLFAGLTESAYTGLRADINEKSEPILIAEHRFRGSLDVAALSDGTVDALYLALRLAVVQEHNETREPLPFVADDLLLNLDDTRAQAALRTLAKIAASGQVLFFTHHAHMADLARTVVPTTILVEHQLPITAEIARSAE
jgi:uncharacterized protein YhaN